ncbi:hypothetical protein K1719_042572 [Acacia pycnantha]|nr:hypothetical protein K1719_042572 [Acacia pycnantha]
MNIQEVRGGDGGAGGGGGGGNDQSQQQPQPPPPQRCPRCNSVNTKFCYYNNYSLSQPRYFCKTCKRYWTHGGSLRNIPIGGGCRKGKRTKVSSSASSSSSAALQLLSRPSQLQPTQPNLMMTSPASRVFVGRSLVETEVAAPGVPLISSYYQVGGYLSSPAAIHSQNPLSQPLFNLSSLNLAPSSNPDLLHPWFNNAPSTQALRSQIPPPSLPVFQSAANRSSREVESVESLHASEDHHHQGMIQTSMSMTMGDNSSYASLHDWSQNSLWSTVSTTSMGDHSGSPSNNNDDHSNDNNNNANKAGGSSSLSGNQWPDLPGGYGPPS